LLPSLSTGRGPMSRTHAHHMVEMGSSCCRTAMIHPHPPLLRVRQVAALWPAAVLPPSGSTSAAQHASTPAAQHASHEQSSAACQSARSAACLHIRSAACLHIRSAACLYIRSAACQHSSSTACQHGSSTACQCFTSTACQHIKQLRRAGQQLHVPTLSSFGRQCSAGPPWGLPAPRLHGAFPQPRAPQSRRQQLLVPRLPLKF
jgi:hypothetical protein